MLSQERLFTALTAPPFSLTKTAAARVARALSDPFSWTVSSTPDQDPSRNSFVFTYAETVRFRVELDPGLQSFSLWWEHDAPLRILRHALIAPNQALLSHSVDAIGRVLLARFQRLLWLSLDEGWSGRLQLGKYLVGQLLVQRPTLCAGQGVVEWRPDRHQFFLLFDHGPYYGLDPTLNDTIVPLWNQLTPAFRLRSGPNPFHTLLLWSPQYCPVWVPKSAHGRLRLHHAALPSRES